MPTTILQATVGAGKTEAALARLSQIISDPQRPFARVWVLLATKRQEVAFRQRLIDLQDGRIVYFNAEFFNFYELNARLLNIAGKPPRRINEPARLGLLRKVLYDLSAKNLLPTFKPIVGTSGFVRVVADLIYELKQNRVFPETYLKAAQQSSIAKDHELALIYDTYQALMQSYDLVDREGEGWLALEALENQASLASDVNLLLVDGYDQFTPVQASLLATMSQRVDDLIVTLTKAPDERDKREQAVIGRRFVEARERLIASHESINTPYQVIDQDIPKVTKQDDLITLAQNIFSDKPAVASSGGIYLIEAPEPLQEVAAVMRSIKSLLLDGTRPDDILVALRDWSRYHTYMEMYTRLYDLPMLLNYGEPLVNNPAITVLMDVLSLAGENPNAVTSFKRRHLLDVLRSPYIQVAGIGTEEIALLDKISQEKQVLGGYDNWLDAIDASYEGVMDEDGNLSEPLIDRETGSDLSLSLEDFFDAVTAQTVATHLEYAQWLEDLIGDDKLIDPDDVAEDSEMYADIIMQPHDDYTLHMPQSIRAVNQDGMEHIVNRDATALNQFKDLLRGILSTQDFLRSALKDSTVTIRWVDFFADILAGVRNARPVQRNPIRSGRVLVTTASESRGLPHEHIYILGLSEGIFPADVPEDPIYLDTERERLKADGVMLQTQAERADDDGIFYELISQARQSLTLSRPHVRDGKYWVESHLWRMTRAVFTNLEPHYIGIGQVVPPDNVASLDEAVIAVADGLSDPQRKNAIIPLYQWLTQTHGMYWQHIEQGYQTEYQRLSDAPHDIYSGRLAHHDLIEIIADKYDDTHTWSATRLNSYGHCGYRFFAGNVLNLEALKPPQEGLDALQMGSLNHDILEQTYAVIKEEDLTIHPDNLDDAHEILQEESEKLFTTAPEKYKFRPSALWREEQDVILRRLQRMIDLDFSDESPFARFGSERKPFALELDFGFGNDEIRIPIADGSIKVRGKIDRIDWVDGKLVIVDYKTGSSSISTTQIADGRNFQMMIYLLALQEKLKQSQHFEIAGGFFWHIRNQSVSGKMSFNDAIADDETIQAGQAHVATYLQKIRNGNFAVQPTHPTNNRCTSYCEFYQLCRLSNTYQYKKEQ